MNRRFIEFVIKFKKKFEIIIKNIFQIFIVIRTNKSLKLKFFFQKLYVSKNFRSIVSKIIKTRQKFYSNILKLTNMFVFIFFKIKRLIFKFLLFKMKSKHNRYKLRLRNDNENRIVINKRNVCDDIELRNLNSQLNNFVIEIFEILLKFFILNFEMSILNSIILLINFEFFFSKNKTIKIVKI